MHLKLGTIPDEVFELTWLEQLDVDNCGLTELSPKIAALKKLQRLDARRNQLTTLPPEIGKLTSLTALFLHSSQLATLPPEIGQLTSLTALSLSSNQLTTLPPEIGQLTSLTTLHFFENPLTTLPPEIGQLDLNDYEFGGNRFSEPLAAALSRGWGDARAYLRGLADAQKCYEAKLVLVGEGNVGKTSLVAALNHEDFVENRSTTHGIEVRSVEVEHPEESDVRIRLNSWDFGGQAVYRITHQFFFSQRSLFLVVWWPREGVEQNDVEGWIERIQLRVGDEARVLVVASHCSEHGRVPRINQEALKRRFGDIIVGFHAVDSRELYKIDELKTAIAQAASQLPQMGEDMPAAWQRVREEIRQLEDVQIPMSRFQELCAQHKVEDDAIPALANLMNDLGDVVYFSDAEGLKETIILNPEWLTKAIGYVLEDQRTNAEAGVLAWHRLHEIWSSDRPDREDYPRDKHPFFLRLMEQFDISFRLGNSTSLVGQLVPAREPAEVQVWKDAAPTNETQPADLVLVCRLSADAPGLIPWLIVRTNWYSQNIHWQSGMLLNHAPHGEALIELVGRNLRITVRAAYPTYFADILKDTADFLITTRWPGLTSRWAVPCFKENCSGLLNLSVLRTRQKKKESDVSCPECGEDLQIDQLIKHAPKDKSDIAIALSTAKEVETFNTGRISRSAMALRMLRNSNFARKLESWIYTTSIQTGEDWSYRGWCQMPGCEHPVNDWTSAMTAELHPEEFLPTQYTGAIIQSALRHVWENRPDDESCQFAAALQSVSEKEFEWSENASVELTEFDRIFDMVMRRHDHLQRVRSPDGEYLWVCDEHRKLFDPGLPEIPETVERVAEPVVRPFSLKSIRIRNFRSIDDLTIPLLPETQLDGTWTCLAGINGAGKTAILEAIALTMLGPDYVNQVGEKRLGRMIRRVDDNRRSELDLEVDWSGIGTVKLSISIVLDKNGKDARVPSTGDHDDNPDGLPHQFRLLARQHLFLSYGATRNLSDEKDGSDGEDAEIVERQRTLFRPLAHIRGVNSLLAGGEENVPAQKTLKALLEELFEEDDCFCVQTSEKHNALGFGTPKQRLDSFQLPDGYRSSIGWLADLCAEWHRLDTESATKNDFEKMSGLVLVDEIDLHLHPKLQWDLVAKLRRLLPNVQFIVTTHSPMVLTSFDQRELVLLEQKDGKLDTRPADRQIIGFTMIEAYRWLFGPKYVVGGEFAMLENSDDPRDQELVTRLLYQSNEVDAEEADRRLAAHKRLAQAKRDEQESE